MSSSDVAAGGARFDVFRFGNFVVLVCSVRREERERKRKKNLFRKKKTF